jgi:hypothetical protein
MVSVIRSSMVTGKQIRKRCSNRNESDSLYTSSNIGNASEVERDLGDKESHATNENECSNES